MKITTVTVECHEKRNHPTGEYSHFDSRVALTAEIDPGEDAQIVVANLQFQARQQVAVECDIWVNGILTREAQDRARNDLQWLVDRLENRLPTDTDAEQFEKKLTLLPDTEHAEWRAKLKATQGEYLTGIKGDLDRIIERAGRKQLSPREISDFDDLVTRLPESERQGYIDQYHAAMDAYELSQAPQPEDTATRVEIKGSGDKEEVPF